MSNCDSEVLFQYAVMVRYIAELVGELDKPQKSDCLNVGSEQNKATSASVHGKMLRWKS